MIGFGPSLKYTLDGEAGDVVAGDEVQRLRGELLVYWFPEDLKSGGRLGVGPFVDHRVAGTDRLHQTEYGVLVDLRLGTTIFEY